MSVALITDSTANLPATQVAYWHIGVVPVQVVVDDEVHDEGDGFDSVALAAALRRGARVSTSRPAPARFADAYAAAAAAGATSIVSVHLAEDLSGTVDAARQAAKVAPVPVTVVDSHSISMGLGFGVIAAARVLKRGAGAAEAAAACVATASRARVLFYVESLDYLARGGRINAAQRLVGTALAMKPILHLAKGRVQPLEKVRTAGRALARLEELAVTTAEDRPVSVAVMHLDAGRRAGDLVQRLRSRLPDAEVLIGDLGAVIGCHVGPGAIAVVVGEVPAP